MPTSPHSPAPGKGKGAEAPSTLPQSQYRGTASSFDAAGAVGRAAPSPNGRGRGGALRLCSNKVQRGCTRRWLKPPGPSLREAPRSPRRSVKSTDTDRVKDAQLANSNPRRRWQASVRACPSSRSDRPGRSQRGRARPRAPSRRHVRNGLSLRTSCTCVTRQ